MFNTLLSTIITFVITMIISYLLSIHIVEFIRIYELGLLENERLKKKDFVKEIKEEMGKINEIKIKNKMKNKMKDNDDSDDINNKSAASDWM